MRLGTGGNKAVKTGKPKVFVTDGKDVALRGICLLFSRPQPGTAITETNITKVSGIIGYVPIIEKVER